jgi:predicted  nucleic acid-binding Zn-ribbon protein
VAASDDNALLHRLKKLSAQLDSAKESAEETVKEVARAQETSEKVRKAVAPLHPSEAPLGRIRRAQRKK